MKYKSILNKLFTILALILFLSVSGTGFAKQIEDPEVAFPTVITYQGYLVSNGQPVNNTCNIRFRLWDDQSGGGPVSPELEDKYEVIDGRFIADLDFGNVFNGAVLWLQIAVNCEGDADYTELPRQALRSTPYSMDADKVDNQHSSAFATAGHNHDSLYFGLSHDETLTGNNVFSGINTFSRPSGSPFYVASMTVVPNLDADLLDGQHNTAFQARVSNACAQGFTIKSINADGTVVCEPHETSPVFSAGTTVMLEDYAPSQNAITIGSDGLPVIAFNNAGYLYVAHCNDLACTTASINLVEDAGGNDTYPAIAIGTNGFPIISYYYWGISGASKDLRVARCTDLACSTATFNTVGGTSDDVGTNSSIVIDNFGNPVISYINETDHALEFVQCSDSLCDGWSSSPLDVGSVYGETSITISGDGAPLISYKKSNNLTTWHCWVSGNPGSSYNCLNSYTKTTIDASDSNGSYNSITTGNDGFGVISYYSSTAGDLRVAHCDDFLCSASTRHTLDSTDTTGLFTAISIGSDGLPVISYNYTYSTTTKYLRVAHCSDPVCHSWTLANVDETAGTKGETSIAIGMDGMPVISYQNENGTGELKFSHCSNVFCMPWFRRR